MPDNWANREMQCRTCMWYLPKADTDGEVRTLGRCRRRAPTMNGYPTVFFTDWCGDHKLRESPLLEEVP